MEKMVELASSNSVWRGMDYYEKNKVIDWTRTREQTYSGTVQGENIYHVSIDKEHPAKVYNSISDIRDMIPTTMEELNPPLKKAPRGASLIIRHSTEEKRLCRRAFLQYTWARGYGEEMQTLE